MTDETTTIPAGGVAAAEHTRSGQCYRPQVDILEQGDELLLRADVPGTSADQIDVKFEDGALTLHAVVTPRTPANGRYLLREYGVGDFYRTFQVSEVIDAGKISAECRDGVLTLHLPKAEAVKPRKIAVKS
ncbi:MAG: Hsp20/alpha crystallin family protein [Pirellulales bacterium]|nr:Hsp20/alpha crystallin family protein [Pirellulales bacterium]